MIRLPLRVLLSLVVLLAMLIPFFVTARLGFRRANASLVRRAFHLGVLIWGIKVTVKGQLSDKKPLLIVSNHFSYVDVFALGSVSKVRFTPKSEIAGWPLIGFFCKITGCLFIDRRAHQTLKNKAMLDEAVHEGDIISLFAEGTTNDGTGLLPFKSAFFSIAAGHDVAIQPVSIVYKKVNGKKITLENRHLVGWYGDMDFFPHVLTFLQQKSVEVTLVFHEPVNGRDYTGRKELAGYCREKIDSAMSYAS